MRQITPEEATAMILETVPALQEEGRASMGQAVELTLQRMTELMPHGATGEMERDVTHSVRMIGDGFSGKVIPRSPHARFVDQGTGQGKTIRNRHGSAYSAETGLALSAENEAADPFGALTATGWTSRSPGRPLALKIGGQTIFRQSVRGQRARHFVQHTRDSTHNEVVELLAGGAERATDRLLR